MLTLVNMSINNTNKIVSSHYRF